MAGKRALGDLAPAIKSFVSEMIHTTTGHSPLARTSHMIPHDCIRIWKCRHGAWGEHSCSCCAQDEAKCHLMVVETPSQGGLLCLHQACGRGYGGPEPAPPTGEAPRGGPEHTAAGLFWGFPGIPNCCYGPGDKKI